MYYFGTKYDSPADEIIAILSEVGEGYGIESTGECESPFGYVTISEIPLCPDLGIGLEGLAAEYDVDVTTLPGWYLVTYLDNGMVSVRECPGERQAREDFEKIAEDYGQWADDSDDE